MPLANIKFAIPSYKRSDIIKSHTLAVLKNYNIPNKQIFIFVASIPEYEEYYNKLDNANECYNIVIGQLGLANQRNFITKYFKEGQYIINMDDDIEQFTIYDKENRQQNANANKPLTIDEFKYYCLRGFKFCKMYNSYIWGINASRNPKFMTNRTVFYPSLIVGYFWACINRHDIDLSITMDIKEDYERTIKYYKKDGIIIKFNNIQAISKIYKNDGGLQTIYTLEQRQNESLKNSHHLVSLFPEYINTRNKNLKNGNESLYTEITFIKQINNKHFEKLPYLNKDDELIISLLDTLNKTDLKINLKRLNSGIGISQCFGKYNIRKRSGLFESVNNAVYPELYKILLEYGEKYVKPFIKYTSIQVNKNYQTKAHIDKNNYGNSYIIGLGNYKRGELVVNGYIHDIHYKPILFNGSIWEHETMPFDGIRYSLVFFNLAK